MTTIVRDYNEEILETMRDLSRHYKWWSAPINLGGAGGASGGGGGPIGGTYGFLPQQRVAYDSTEAAYQGIQTHPPSGTLYDNLSHIRYRLNLLEAGSGGGGSGISSIEIRDEGVSAGNVTVLDFVGASVAALVSTGIATITVTASGGGHTIQDAGTPLTQRSNLNFVGPAVSVADDSGNDATVVTISASGGGGATTFLDLTDVTPTSYSGQAGKSVVVNNSENGLEFVDISGGGGSTTIKYYTTISGGSFVENTGGGWNVEVVGSGNWHTSEDLAIDDNTATLAYGEPLSGAPYMVINFGSTKNIDAIRIYNDVSSSDVPDGYLKVWMSDSGLFTGEQTLVAHWDSSLPTYTGGWIEYIFNEATASYSLPAIGQYMKIEAYKNSANWWRIYELSVRNSAITLAVANLPMGAKVEVIGSGGGVLDSATMETYSDNHIEFTASGIDRVKLYEPDGSTTFYDSGASWSHTIGGVYVVWPY